MKTKLHLLLFVIACQPLFAQYELKYPKWYPETAFKNLYVLAGQSETEYGKSVIEIIKANWKLTPVSVISGVDIPAELLVKGNLFYCVTSAQYTRSRSDGEVRATNDYLHLDIWTVKDEYKPGKDWEKYGFIVGRAELYNKWIGNGFLSDFSKDDFTSDSFSNDYLNGMAGNIKNMIQFFNSEIPKGQPKDLLHDLAPDPQIKKLKTETLFVPNYWYGELGTIIGLPSPTNTDYPAYEKYIQKLVAAYDLKLKLITRDDLNQMILNADKDFYYLNYIQSSADKIISVINGLTGEVIYSENGRKVYRIKNSDLEKIAKAAK